MSTKSQDRFGRSLISSSPTGAPSVDGLFVLDEPNKRDKVVGDARISIGSALASARGSKMGTPNECYVLSRRRRRR